MKKWFALLFAAALLVSFASAEAPRIFTEGGSSYLIGDGGASIRKIENTAYSFADAPLIAPDGQIRLVGLTAGEPDEYGDPAALYTLLDENGNALTAEFYDYLYERNGSLIVYRDGYVGALDWDGTELIAPGAMSLLEPVGDGSFLGTRDEMYGPDGMIFVRIGADGTQTDLNLKLDYLGEFTDGLAPAQIFGGATGVIDSDGHWKIPPVYTSINSFSENFFLVYDDPCCGLMDRLGRIVLPVEYDSISRYAVEEDMDVGCVIACRPDGVMQLFSCDKLELLVEVPDVAYAFGYSYDRVSVMMNDGSGRVYDSKGELVLEFSENQYLAGSYGDVTILYDSDKDLYQIVKRGGEVLADDLLGAGILIEDDGSFAGILIWDGRTVMSEDGYRNVIPSTLRHGLYDLELNEILPKVYDSLWLFGDGILRAQRAEKFGLIDYEGNWLLEFTDYGMLQD